MSETRLEDLFHECDRSGEGRIGPQEFQELCEKFEISESDAEVIFMDLDRDGDGQICLEDFAWGFRDFLDQPNKSPRPQSKNTHGTRRGSRAAWSHFVSTIGEPAVQKLFQTSGKKLADLYLEIQNCSPSSDLITQFEGALSSLMEDVKRLHEDNEKLEDMFNKERQSHLLRLRGLEEEIDAQVAKVEAQARDEAREKFEFEKKELMKKMEAETIELKTHLKLFQKVNTVLSQKKGDKTEMDETIEESRELRRKLIDTQTNLAIVRSEMEKLRNEYETKCQQFNKIYVSNYDEESGAQYTIKRLMDDIDSGHSTLLDVRERDLADDMSNASSIIAPYNSNKTLDFEEMSLSGSIRERDLHMTHLNTPMSAMSVNSYDIGIGGDPERTYKIVFAGDAAVGKTCFIHRFCKGIFATKLGSTLGVDFQVKTVRVDDRIIALQLWDTAGQERFRSITKAYFRRADGIVLMYDVTNERTFLNIRQWIISIMEVSDKEIPVCICGNKVDLRSDAESQGITCVSTECGALLAKENNALFFETSSKLGTNINTALVMLSREMLIKEDVDIQTSSMILVEQNHKINKACC
ncbi:ras and EF-hand domain-containing protein homolog isoform X2 [Daktulosphaira vitifoliae]|uniref:ras and EF-hand domain-containing protein homolog isoform X2 n=1 Tax=Daktulosphaira vitifoliae TaxID=58002 RepID=UPI0021A9E985|nr:ras and EF-hand domain-containing protein homolog isoform X2 [Daktulosphaira vitifoliae]